MSSKPNLTLSLSIVSIMISMVAIFISINHASNIQYSLSNDTEKLPSNGQTFDRVYGFSCNQNGQLWERRREKIDVTESVWINKQLVHCEPNAKDINIGDGSYLMGVEGVYSINGVNYPREEVVLKWYAELAEKARGQYRIQ